MGRGGAAARGDHSSLLLPMFSAAAASDFNTFRPVRPSSLSPEDAEEIDSEKCVPGQKKTGGALCQMRRKEGRWERPAPSLTAPFCILRCSDHVTRLPSVRVRVVRSRRHENLDAAAVTNGRRCGGAAVDPGIIGKVKPNLLSCQHSRSSHLRLGQLVNSNLLGGGRDIFRQRGPRLSRIPPVLPSHCSRYSIR